MPVTTRRVTPSHRWFASSRQMWTSVNRSIGYKLLLRISRVRIARPTVRHLSGSFAHIVLSMSQHWQGSTILWVVVAWALHYLLARCTADNRD
jgi:hypothetical protein